MVRKKAAPAWGLAFLNAIYLDRQIDAARRRIVSSCRSGSTDVIRLQGSHL
jgi:hypothetical protein